MPPFKDLIYSKKYIYDVIWNAFQEAGYSLKDLLDEDIKNNPTAYPTIETPDPNIDFRRVRNLKIFLERHAQILETDDNQSLFIIF